MPDDLDILASGMEDLQHALVRHQCEERREIDVGRQRVDDQSLVRARHLHHAQDRVIGAFAQKLGVDGHARMLRQPGAGLRKRIGGGDRLHVSRFFSGRRPRCRWSKHTGNGLGGSLQTGSTDSPETLVSFYNPAGNGSPDEAARSAAQSGKGAPDYAPAEQALHPGYGCPRTRGMWMNSHGLGISPTGTSITLGRSRWARPRRSAPRSASGERTRSALAPKLSA